MVRATEGVPVDLHVGRRLRMRRVALGLSQQRLAERLGVTFQQVQKYERAANRISASTLFALASALRVPVSYFFDGLEDPAASDAAGAGGGGMVESLLVEPHGARLAEAFLSIRRRGVRRDIANLVEVIAELKGDGGRDEGA
jgi:transcriptional regulator with XRE-family HTH domain